MVSNRPMPLTAEQQAEAGSVVLSLRRSGFAWKEIERVFGTSTRQLRRYVTLHESRMSHFFRRMSHHAD